MMVIKLTQASFLKWFRKIQLQISKIIEELKIEYGNHSFSEWIHQMYSVLY